MFSRAKTEVQKIHAWYLMSFSGLFVVMNLRGKFSEMFWFTRQFIPVSVNGIMIEHFLRYSKEGF